VSSGGKVCRFPEEELDEREPAAVDGQVPGHNVSYLIGLRGELAKILLLIRSTSRHVALDTGRDVASVGSFQQLRRQRHISKDTWNEKVRPVFD